MTLHEFVDAVAVSNDFVAIHRKDGFVDKTGEYWCDTVEGFSWCTRKGFRMGQDWNLRKVEVQAIEVYHAYGKDIPCAVID